MKTDDLIKALVADAPSSKPPIGRTLSMALAAGAVAAAAIFAAAIGMRPNFGYVVTHSWQFVLKFIFTLAVLIPAALMVRELARPEGDAASVAPWLVLPAGLMLAAMAYSFSNADAGGAASTVFGPNWLKCCLLIPLLSLTPLAAVLYALKQGAPANPALAGAVGGLLSGAIGATLYASYCDSDSPLFVGVWYSLGIAAMAALGGAIGSKLLRW